MTRIQKSFLALSLAVGVAFELGANAPRHGTSPVLQARDDLAELEDTARRLYAADQLEAARKLYEELAERTTGARRSEALALAAWIAYLDDETDRARALLVRLRSEDSAYELSADQFDDSFLELDRALRGGQPAPEISRAADPAELDRAFGLLDAGDWDAARRALREILASDPGAPGTALALARLERRDGAPERALAVLEPVARRLAAATPAAANPRTHAAVLEEIGLASLSLGRLEDAMRAFERATDLDPGSAASWQNLAVARQRAGHVEEAIAAYRQALQLAPDPTLRTNLARLLASRQRWAEAAEVLLPAAERGTLEPAQLLELGRALRGEGRLDDARHWLSRALAASRGASDGTVVAQCATELAFVELQDARAEAALEAARVAVEAAPADVEAHHAYGLALIATDQAARAVEELEIAQDLAPTRADIANNLGRALFARGDYGAAAEHFRTAIELDPLLAAAAENLRLAETRRDAARSAEPAARAPYPGITVADAIHRASGRPAAEVLVVEPGSAADRAGLETGDLILRAGRRGIRDADDLRNLLRSVAPGDSLRLDLVRGGDTLSLELTRPG